MLAFAAMSAVSECARAQANRQRIAGHLFPPVMIPEKPLFAWVFGQITGDFFRGAFGDIEDGFGPRRKRPSCYSPV